MSAATETNTATLSVRAQWCEWAWRLSGPLLAALDKRELKLRLLKEGEAALKKLISRNVFHTLTEEG